METGLMAIMKVYFRRAKCNHGLKPGFHIIAPVATVATVANKIIQRRSDWSDGNDS